MADPAAGIRPTGEQFGISNEFAGVLIQRVLTVQGDRLEVLIPKTGVCAYLDPMQLEVIATLPPKAFSELIKRVLDDQQPH